LTKINDYRYDLTITDFDDNTLRAFATAFSESIFADYMAQDPDEPNLFTTEVCYQGGGIFKSEVEEQLHDLAILFPTLTLHFTAEDLDDRSHGYELKCKGDLFQQAELINSLSAFCPPVPFSQREEALRKESERSIKVQQLTDNLCHNTDYDLLYAQKQALVHSMATGAAVPNEVLSGLINFLDQVGDLGETLGRFQYDGIDPPFPLQSDYIKKNISFSQETISPEPKPIHVLIEELDNGNDPASFSVLAASEDPTVLRALLQAKIKKDEYGYICNNGIAVNTDDCFETIYEDGNVFYNICETIVANKTNLAQLLQSPEYDTTFHYADNLTAILQEVLHCTAQAHDFEIINMEDLVSFLLQDPQFHAFSVDHEFYFDVNHIEDRYATVVMDLCKQFLHDRLHDDTAYFKNTGAIKMLVYPDNLKDILIDCIYATAAAHCLPIHNAELTAESILHDPIFRAFRNEHCKGTPHLINGTSLFQNIAEYCMGFTYSKMVGERPANRRPSINTIIYEANLRQKEPASATKDHELDIS